MFRRRRKRTEEEERHQEASVIYVYRGKSKKYIPRVFSKKRQIPREIPHVTIHSSVRKIPENAFRDHESLVRVCIPRTCKKIGAHAFLQCQSLAEVEFEKGLKKIGPGAFLNTLLVIVNLPQGLTEIGDFCFSGCTSLRLVSTVKTLKTIGSGAFLGCVQLAHVDFEEGLKWISPLAFSDCKALSVIALPESLKAIESRAFLYCTSLLGAEFLPSTKVKLGFECFYGCRALANVYIPDSIESLARNAFDECDCLLTENSGFQISRLRNRYESLPVHRTCYYSRSATLDDLLKTLGTSSLFEDAFGMTPFHVLATSANPRLDFLECLLDRCTVQILSRRDLSGRTMMDYLLLSTSNKAIPLIQLVLFRTIVDRISTWDQGAWGSEFSAMVEAIGTEEDMNARRKYVHEIYQKAGYSAMVEIMTILELATWKMRLKAAAAKHDDSETNDNYRASCQYQCGAGVVIENVSRYLWDPVEAKSETAKSTFRLFDAVDPGGSPLGPDNPVSC